MEFASGIFFIIGLITLWYYRSLSRENFFFRRAPQLKINEIHTFDDGWFTGLIEAPEVVVAPFFGTEAVSYHYCLYEKVVKYEKDSNGRSRRVETWELYDSASNSVPFILDDGTGKMIINPSSATHKFPLGESWQNEHWRHTLSYFPSTGIVSCVGVVSEDKKHLIPKGETPLMITPMGRKSFMESIKSEEKYTKIGGLVCLWASALFGFYSLDEHFFQLPIESYSLFVVMAIFATIPFAGCYYYFTNNSLILLRAKVINSWANVDVELKNRRELIPNLLTIVNQHLQYEKETFIKLSDLRAALTNEKRLGQRIKYENKISDMMNDFLLKVEAHPELNDESVKLLQKNLVTIENKIAHAKSHFNAVVEEYNSLIEGFPSNIIANAKKFSTVPFYDDKPRGMKTLGKNWRRTPSPSSSRKQKSFLGEFMYILVGAILVVALIVVVIYNGMISGRNGVKAGLANIDVELKRRFDLIPNLIEVAKKYMEHESSTLLAVVAARNDALSALAALRNHPFDENSIAKMGQAEQKLSNSLNSFKAVAEGYPQLKADGMMLKMMNELADTENRISFTRQNYNDLVMKYNNSLEVFPNVLLANMFNFTPGTSWTIERAEERENVKVTF